MVFVVGHRGMGRSFVQENIWRENTIPSFEAAHRSGATWVECDAIIDKDENIWLWHNHFVEDKEGTPQPVWESPSKPFIKMGTEKFSALPQLTETLNVNLEIKPVPGETLKRQLVGVVSDWFYSEKTKREILLSSFDPSIVTMLHTRFDIPVDNLAWITREGYPLIESVMAVENLPASTVVVHSPTTLENAEGEPSRETGLRLALHNNTKIWGWDVSTSKIRPLAAEGVEGFCTDDVANAATEIRNLQPITP